MQPIQLFAILLLSTLLLSACATPPTPTAADNAAVPLLPTPTAALPAEATPAEQPAADSAPAPAEAPAAASAAATADNAAPAAATTDASASDQPAAVARPAWQQIAMTDARSGATFTLADFAGKTVFVEPFATWCGNCRQQLGNVQAAKATLGDDVVFVALSVEPNIGADALTSYADDAGFDWVFAAMPPELLQALAAQYGQTIANPPATPHFIIRPDGSTTDLVTGIEAPEAIVAQIEAARS